MRDDVRALEIFERAVALAPDERSRYTAQACGGDAAVLARVRALLAADARAHPLLDSPPGALLARRPPAVGAWDGRRVGPYQLVREIGRGGMGIVCLGERADVGTRVAVKILTDSLTSPERLARFDYERRVLARLDHPHIARFLDAGVTEDAAPWLAMELVDGAPIDAHADARCLTIDERVRLLEQVADAVAHAHRNLLVHRDLKPSNILVSDTGVPKLVDFGIVKLLDAGASDDALTGDAAAGPMTLEYASPEQVRGEAITTASDVYQLGIVMHELLTGRRQLREDGEPLRHFDRAAGVPMLRPSSIVGREVQPPQLAGGLLTRTARDVAAQRGVTAPQLQRQLAGDLDNIMAMALHADPSRRYPSAHELAEDLRRYRRGDAVLARSGSVAYRARKFVRRHAVVTALGAGSVLVLATSTIAVIHQSRDRALERDRAEQVSRVLERLVRYAAPGPNASDSAAARSILTEVAVEGLAGLKTEPEVWARILDPLASVYAQTTQPDTGMLLWRAVIDALAHHDGGDHPMRVQAMASLGITMVQHGDFAGGLAVLERMLGSARKLPEDRRAQFANNLSFAAFGRQVAGDDRGARRLYEETLRIALTLPDSGGRTYDRTLMNFAWLEAREGDAAAAEPMFRRVLARRMKRHGPADAGTMNAMGGLARVLVRLGATDEAARMADTVLAVRRRIYSPPHPNLAEALDLRSAVLFARGQVAAAEVSASEALAMYRQVYGDEHFIVAYAQTNLARAVAAQDRQAEALDLQRRATALYERTAGPSHPGTLAARIALAEFERTAGRTAEAEEIFRATLTAWDSIAPNRPALAKPLASLGSLLAANRRCAEAEPYLRRALALGRDPEERSRATAGLLECGRTT